MFRGILAVIVGYIVMALWVFATMTVAWLVLGQSYAFEEGTTEVTMPWSVIAIALGFIGAVLGGLIAAAISRSPTNRPVKVLAGIVLVLGLAQAVSYLYLGEPDADEEAAGALVVEDEEAAATGELTFWEAASEAVPPTWYSFTIPFVGMFGVLIGGGLRGRRTAAPEAGPPGA